MFVRSDKTEKNERMASLPLKCLIHFKGESGQLTNFTEVSFKKFMECREIWVTLDGDQREIAERTAFIEENEPSLAYHRGCYSKFTNKTFINRAQTRCEKERERQDTNATADNLLPAGGESITGTSAKKLLRSTLKKQAIAPKSKHVLPPTCIICKKEKSFVTEVVSDTFLLYFSFYRKLLHPTLKARLYIFSALKRNFFT